LYFLKIRLKFDRLLNPHLKAISAIVLAGSSISRREAALMRILFRQSMKLSESGIHQLINSTDNFNSILIFLSLLNQLAHDQAYTVLSHSHFSKLEDTYDSRRVRTIMEYLNSNYHRPVRLSEMAALVNMSEPSFSRFIKRRTGYNFIDCLNNILIGANCFRSISPLPWNNSGEN